MEGPVSRSIETDGKEYEVCVIKLGLQPLSPSQSLEQDSYASIETPGSSYVSTKQPLLKQRVKTEPINGSNSPSSEEKSVSELATSKLEKSDNNLITKTVQSPQNENESTSDSIDYQAAFPSFAEMETTLAAFSVPITELSGLDIPSDQKKMYQCPHPGCLSNFDRPYRLAQHILAHKNIRPYACDKPNCTKAYTSKSHLDRHKITAHKPQSKDIVYSCPQCMSTFVNRQNLKRHMNTVHTSEFKCEFCEMRFKKKNQLNTHMYQHTGIKAFKCDLCTETFISLYLKKRHMRYHKMYTCELCNTEFNHWSKFQKHKKTEHDKNEFICNECGRVFKQRAHILRHVKIHTEAHKNKTYLCPYENCTRFYSRNSNLKQHILVTHMKMFHICPLCSAELSSKAKLNHHMNLHYRSGLIPIKQPSLEDGRKQRKDAGSLKSSTALKLAGLSEVPEELTTNTNNPVTVKSECIEIEVDIPIKILN